MKMSGIAGKFAALAALTMPVTVSAQAAKPCLTKDQLGSLVVAFIPAAMKQLQTTCTANLPANAALNSLTADKLAQFQIAADAAKPKAGEALRLMMGKDVPAGVDGATLLPFIESMVVSGVSAEIKPDACPIANNLWSALAPLPPEKLGELVVSVVMAGTSRDKNAQKVEGKKSPISGLNICPYIAESDVTKP